MGNTYEGEKKYNGKVLVTLKEQKAKHGEEHTQTKWGKIGGGADMGVTEAWACKTGDEEGRNACGSKTERGGIN